jgi:hypothetical protein
MIRRQQDVARLFPSRPWLSFTLSVLVPFILLTVVLLSLSASSVEAEPLAPAADISGTVVQPSGAPITQAAWVCLVYPHPDGWDDEIECKDSESNGSFNFTGTIPSEYLPGDFFVRADAPPDSPYFPSLAKPLHIAADTFDGSIGHVTLTFASFAGTVYEPDGMTLADGGKVTVDAWDGLNWFHVAGAEYHTGTYAIGGVPADPDFRLVAHPPEDSIFVPSPPLSVGVAPGSQYNPLATQLISLTLQSPNLIGSVVYPEDGSPVNWIVSGTDELLGRAWVEVLSLDTGEEIVDYRPTASWGEFGLGLPSGDYWVLAHPEGDLWMTYTRAIPLDVNVPAISDVGPMTLTFPSFSGRILDPVGPPITKCMGIWLEDRTTGEEWSRTDYCGEEGPYKIGGMPAGDYWLMTDGLPERGLFPAIPMSVTVGPGSQYDPLATQHISPELSVPQLTVYVEYPVGTSATANVHLWNEWGDDLWEWAEPGQPALFGGFNAGDVYWLEAWPHWDDVPALANSIVMTVPIEPFPISRTLALRIPTVVGTVETPEGGPLPPAYEGSDPIPHPAEVKVHRTDETWDISMLTNPAGEFSLALPPGDYVLEASPFGNLVFTYTRSLHEFFSLGGTVILPELDLGSIQLTYPSVSGHIFDPADNPIPDCVSVWLEDMTGEWVVDDWYCGGQPEPYRLGGVAGGDYWLKTEGFPHLGLFPPDPTAIHIPPGSQYDPLATQVHDLFLNEAQLEVLVEDPIGTPLAADVRLWDEWGNEIWSASKLDGPASFGGLEPGDYWLQAWPMWPDVPRLANSVEEMVHISPAAGPMSLTLTLNYPDVTGTVKTPGGDPLPPAHDERGDLAPHPAEIHAHNEDWSVDLWATTNPTGEFSLFLPDGPYVLLAKPMHDLVFNYTKSMLRPFTLTASISRPHSLGDIPLTYPRVWGTVVDGGGNPVSTWVNLWSDDGNYWDGDDTYEYSPGWWKPFRLGAMPPGHYYVQADPPVDNPTGYGPSNIHEFTVPPTATEQITLYLGMANVLGDVRFPAGSHCPDCPVQWAEVMVHRDPDDGVFEAWGTTGKDGRFTFRLEPGDYALKVILPPELQAEWAPPPSWHFTVGPPPDQVSSTLYLQPSAGGFQITGQVHTPPSGDPPPPDSTLVELCNNEGLCFGDEVTAGGRFTVTALPGIYHVWVYVDPATDLFPPLGNGFLLGVDGDIELDSIWLRALSDRTAHVTGRVIVVSPTLGISRPIAGIEIEAWTDEGDWNATETNILGRYTLDLFPGSWHGGPLLTPQQEQRYSILSPRYREGFLEDGETAANVDFRLQRRDATIQGQVVEVGQTTPITTIQAIVFAERCVDDVCRISAKSEVQAGTFELPVVGGYTYTLGIWFPAGGYMPGPPVSVHVARDQVKTGVQVGVLSAGTRIWGYLVDGATLERVEIDAAVFGNSPDGYWVEDFLERGDDPYQYNLYVPTPVDEPVTWTLKLGVHPNTGYVPDSTHPKYKVVVEPGETSVGQILYVQQLHTVITGTVGVKAGGVFTPARHIWVFAEGSTPATEGLYFEARTDANGVYTMPVLPGAYLVGAYLPPNLEGKFFPPSKKPWTSTSNNPIDLVFRPKPTGVDEIKICGSLSVSPTGSLSTTTSILIFGWSEDGSVAQVTGTIGDGYCMAVISNTRWYVWAAYEDPADNAFYHSREQAVNVGVANVTNADLMLEKAEFELPDPHCETLDTSRFNRVSLPARQNLPEPLMEIQADTFPVTGTVEVCARPVIAVPNGQYLVGFAYELEARDSQGNLITEDFEKKVRLIFYFTLDTLLPDTDPEDLQVAFYSTARGDWVALEDLFIDPEDLFATGKTAHFSRFGIMSPPAQGGEAGTIMLADVQITGPDTGVLSTTYTFTAIISPISTTTPITYVWEATGVPSVTHLTTSISDTAAFSWTVAGYQVITVTASNGYSSDVATHTINTAGYEIYLPLVMRNS